MEDMKEGVEFAHAHGVKVYVTANILAHNQDLEVRAYFAELKDWTGCTHFGSGSASPWKCARRLSGISVHRRINTNYGTYQFWYEQGQARVVTARELSLAEIKEIRDIPEEMRLRRLFMGRCVFHTREDVCCPIISREEMRTRACTHPCCGSMRSWKSPDRGVSAGV